MGSGIAAQIANAGIPVLLLDMVPDGVSDRNALAKAAIERAKKAEPAPFMSRAAVKLVTPGNIEDHLPALADVDWIVEAIIERPDVKQALYRKLQPHRKPGSVISSNTSTIPLWLLMKDMPAEIATDFCITHFFNPPRYMRLLEVVAGPVTRADAIASVSTFGDERLGKTVVVAKDRPGFIGNRIGVFFMQAATHAAIDMGLTVEEADAVLGRPVGMPKTGLFGLMDLVGLDLLPHVDDSLRKALPKDDAYVALPGSLPLLQKMIANGYTGRKGKGGFYRLNTAGGQRTKESIDLRSGNYAPSVKARLDSIDAAKSGLRDLVTHPDRGGAFAWKVLSQLFAYAASLVPEIADDIVQVDLAMKTGFNWKRGPFEMIDQLGAAWLAERLKAEGKPVPALLASAVAAGGFYQSAQGGLSYLASDGRTAPLRRRPGILLLQDVKQKAPPLARNGSASVWDTGDGVACLEFHSKMNALDPDSLAMLLRAVETVIARTMKGLVIYNEGENFSVGANIGLALFAANVAAWPMLAELIDQGHAVMKAVKYAPFPIVGAPSGMALGGGCEVLLHCAAIQAHAETYMGLVETGVGIVPAWGGCKEMLIRHQPGQRDPKGPMPGVISAFEQISQAKVSKSAAEARDMKFLRAHDRVSMNRDRLLGDARQLALELAENGYKPPAQVVLRLPGPTGRAALDLAVQSFALQGIALQHDVVVASALAGVLTGGTTDITTAIAEDSICGLEKDAFMSLLRSEATLARMEVMLSTGKPLRN